MKYRSRTEIVSMILKSLNSGSTKTRLMYNAFLSYAQLKEYLSYLEKNDFIKYDKETKKYTTTENGRSYLNAYDKICDLLTTNNRL